MYNMHISGTEGLRVLQGADGVPPYWVDWQRNHEPPLPRRAAVVAPKPRRITPRRVARSVARRLGLRPAPPSA